MTGVNIFGTGLQYTFSTPSQRGPPGIGFKHLDADGNFDINHKRLANVPDPIENGDAVNKNYSDLQRTKFREIMDSEYKNMSDSFTATLEENKSLHRSMIDTLNDSINFQSRHIDSVLSQVEDVEQKSVSEEFLTDVLTKRFEITDIKLQSLKAELSSDFAKGFDQLNQELSDNSDVLISNTTDITINAAEIESLKSLVESHQNKLTNAEKIMETLQTGIQMNRDNIEILDNHLSEKIKKLEARINQLVREKIDDSLN